METNYRINYFEQIKNFYSILFEGKHKILPTHTALYMFLLNQNNRLLWAEWFKCPLDIAMVGAQIRSRTTYYKTLNELVSFGLIEYIKGRNDFAAPQIKIVPLVKLRGVSKFDILTVPVSDTVTDTLDDTIAVLLGGNIYKLITNNHKRVRDNLEKWLSLDDDDIFKQNLNNNPDNKPKDREELWEFVRLKAQNVAGFTDAMVKSYAKQIEDTYREDDGIWRRVSDGERLWNWRKQFQSQWLTDAKILEYKNRYLKSKPQEMVASLPKTRTN
jgi:hypothetical protein